jgi:hypothetical protein
VIRDDAQYAENRGKNPTFLQSAQKNLQKRPKKPALARFRPDKTSLGGVFAASKRLWLA